MVLEPKSNTIWKGQKTWWKRLISVALSQQEKVEVLIAATYCAFVEMVKAGKNLGSLISSSINASLMTWEEEKKEGNWVWNNWL